MQVRRVGSNIHTYIQHTYIQHNQVGRLVGWLVRQVCRQVGKACRIKHTYIHTSIVNFSIINQGLLASQKLQNSQIHFTRMNFFGSGPLFFEQVDLKSSLQEGISQVRRVRACFPSFLRSPPPPLIKAYLVHLVSVLGPHGLDWASWVLGRSWSDLGSLLGPLGCSQLLIQTLEQLHFTTGSTLTSDSIVLCA